MVAHQQPLAPFALARVACRIERVPIKPRALKRELLLDRGFIDVDRAELVTSHAAELKAHLQAVTSERIVTLEGIGEMPREAQDKDAEAVEVGADKERDGASSAPKDRGSLSLERDKAAGMDLGP